MFNNRPEEFLGFNPADDFFGTRINQVPHFIVFYRIHKFIGNANADIEIFDRSVLIFKPDKIFDVRMVGI